MIFGDVILAGSMAAAAYLQAEARGIRLFLIASGLFAAGLLGTLLLVGANTENVAASLSGPNGLKIKALLILAFAGAVMTLGLAAGAVLKRWLTPGKVAGLSLVVGYLLINLIYFSNVAGR